MKFYLYQLVIAFDQLLNAVFGGYADETMSSRAWRTEQNGKLFGKLLRPTIDFMATIVGDLDHCRKAYEAESTRKQKPE